MAKATVAALLWRIGETAMARRGARDAAEPDALGLMDTLPDVLMPPG